VFRKVLNLLVKVGVEVTQDVPGNVQPSEKKAEKHLVPEEQESRCKSCL
jgi:hypothetical protein